MFGHLGVAEVVSLVIQGDALHGSAPVGIQSRSTLSAQFTFRHSGSFFALIGAHRPPQNPMNASRRLEPPNLIQSHIAWTAERAATRSACSRVVTVGIEHCTARTM